MLLPFEKQLRQPGYIFLNFCDRDDNSEGIYEEARRRIKESVNAPRHLHILHPGMVDEENAESWETRDALTVDPYIPRPGLVEFIESRRDWEKVEIDLDEYPDFVRLMFPCREHQTLLPLETWKQLRTLSLFTDAYNTPPDGEDRVECGPIWMTKESFPMLRNVRLHLKVCKLEGWTLPWAQLRSLTLEMLEDPFSMYLGILSQCLSLQTFRLRVGEEYDSTDPGNGTMVTAPSLRHVSIHASLSPWSEFTTSFMDKLQLPALRRFEITDSPWSSCDDSFINSLHSCFQRSRCHVRHLCVDAERMQLKKDTLRRLLKATPSLKSLRLVVDAPDVTAKFVMSLRMPKLAEAIINSAGSSDRDVLENCSSPAFSTS